MLMMQKIIRIHRCRAVTEALPEALMLMEQALRAGLSLPQALQVAAEETSGVLGQEFKVLMGALAGGSTLEEALCAFEKRVPAEEVALFVQSVEVLRRSGGNLVETFSLLRATIAERVRVERRIAALTAQGVLQAGILLALPWALFLLLRLMAPVFLLPLYTTRVGLLLIGATLLLELVGALWLARIVRVRV